MCIGVVYSIAVRHILAYKNLIAVRRDLVLHTIFLYPAHCYPLYLYKWKVVTFKVTLHLCGTVYNIFAFASPAIVSIAGLNNLPR